MANTTERGDRKTIAVTIKTAVQQHPQNTQANNGKQNKSGAHETVLTHRGSETRQKYDWIFTIAAKNTLD